MENSDKLSILFLSDIHMNHDNIVKVKQWYIEQGTQIKYIFLLGDFHNIDNTEDHSEQQENKYLDEVYELISPIGDLKPRCFMIPGNHDPKILFNYDYRSKHPNIELIHNKVVLLSEGIKVVGFGGSVPAYIEQNLKWNGYPFISDNEFELSFKKISEEITNQTMLITHCGPSISSTTDSYENYQKITSGSDFLTQILMAHENEIIVQVHGHTHDGHGYRRVQNLSIVNAGPLVWGKFTVIDFNRTNEQKEWVVQNVHILSL